MEAQDASRERDLRVRTKGFALMIVRLYAGLPDTAVAQVLGRQMLRSGTPVGAHYREATRARSKAEFISKLEGGLQELEETIYWLELLDEAGVPPGDRVRQARLEAEEVAAMLTASVRTVKGKRRGD
jgi:four helix bundle protein